MENQRSRSGTRTRTRQAILDAAISVLARDQTVPLADIAATAYVSRTTLHRHFNDRDELRSAATAEANEAIAQAITSVDTASGDVRQALHQLIAGLIEAGDRILFLFGTYSWAEDETPDEDPSEPDDDLVLRLIRTGQENGTLTSDLDPRWIQNALWSLVFAGCEEGRDPAVPRHIIATKVIRTLEGGIITDGPAGADR